MSRPSMYPNKLYWIALSEGDPLLVPRTQDSYQNSGGQSQLSYLNPTHHFQTFNLIYIS